MSHLEKTYTLKLDGNTIAKISRVHYETPWMSGKVVFYEPTLFEKLVAVSAMTGFDLEVDALNVDDAEEDRLWDAKMLELNLSWDDLKLIRNSLWTISSNKYDSQPIYSPQFYASGWVDWRQ